MVQKQFMFSPDFVSAMREYAGNAMTFVLLSLAALAYVRHTRADNLCELSDVFNFRRVIYVYNILIKFSLINKVKEF